MDRETAITYGKIDGWLQVGYEAWHKKRLAHTREFWRQAWELIVDLMATGHYATLDELNKAFGGKHGITSWAADYGDVLYQYDSDHPDETPASLAFNRQVLAWSANPRDLNNQNRRRMIAICTFKHEGPAAGDAVFAAYLAENPSWGWGWASWADQYGFDSQTSWYDLARAEAILRQSLTVEALDSRATVRERLRDVLLKQGRPSAAAAIELTDTRRQI